jgi:hypothetical protein
MQEVVKVGLGQHPNFGFNQRIGGGGMAFAGKQGNLAKEVAWP